MVFFRNQKFLFVHKRNFNPKVKLFLIKLSADINQYFQTLQQVLYFFKDFEMYTIFLTDVILL